MNSSKIKISILIFLVLLPFIISLGISNNVRADGNIYYVRNDGNDTRCTGLIDAPDPGSGGAGQACSWATISKVNSASFSPGDQILFKRGGTWRETLTTPSAGTSGSPITFGAYGTGSAPILSGANLVSSLTEGSESPEESGGLFSSGFETAAFADWSANTSLCSSLCAIAIGTGQKNHGTSAMQLTGNGTDNRIYATKNITAMSSGDTYYFRFYAYVPSAGIKTSSEWRAVRLRTGSADTTFLSLYTNSSGNIYQVSLNGTGTNAGGLIVNGASVSWNMNAWNMVEFSYKAAASGGGGQVWINGVSVASNFSVNSSGGIGVNAFRLGNDAFGGLINSGTSIYFDDVRIATSGPIGGFNASVNGGLKVWRHTISTEPTQLFIDGERGKRVSALTSIVSYRDWYYDSGTTNLYIRGPNDGTTPIVEASVRNSVISVTNNYNNFENLDVTRGALYGISGAKNGTAVRDSIVQNAFVDNIRFASSAQYANNIIEDNIIHDAGANGILLNENSLDARIRRNTVYNNSRLHQTLTGGSADQQWSAGIKMWGNNVSNSGQGGIIENNIVYDNKPHSWVPTNGGEDGRGVGIWADEVKIPTGAPLAIRNNKVYGNASWGIYLEKTQRASASYNVIYNNAASEFTANLAIHSNSGVSALESSLYNNTIYGTGWWMVLFGGNGSVFTDNVFKNNIIYPTDASSAFIYFQGDGDNLDEGNELDYNIYGNANPIKLYASDSSLGVNYTSFATWKTASGQDSHSYYADPLFTDVDTNDYSLQIDSPGVNTALNVGLTLDFAGMSVPQGISPDIGAFEFSETIAPVTTDSGIDSIWHSSDVIVTLTCDDGDGIGCAHTYYTTDGSTPTTASSEGTSFSLTTSGIYTIKYFSVDSFGNQESVKTAVNTVKVDKTAPTGTISINSGASTTNTTNVTLTLNSIDIHSGNYQMMVSEVNSFTGAIWETYTTSKAFTLSGTTGTKTVYAKFKDNVGNISVAVSDSIIYDISSAPPPSEPELPIGCNGDYDSDGIVGIGDFSVFGQNYKKQSINCSLDIDGGDCFLNIRDFSNFAKVYKNSLVCKSN